MFDRFKPLHDRALTPLLLLLIATDAAFIAIHLVYINTGIMMNPTFSIETDRGYAEIYQYVKFFWIVLLMTYLLISQKTLAYLAWILVFGYLLLDDATSLHESFGDFLEARYAFEAPFNLRVQDVGELALSVMAATVLLGAVISAYLAGSRVFRSISRDLLLLLAALAACGVGFDLLHIMVQLGGFVRETFGVLEDGGEMLVVSLLLWYSFWLVVQQGQPHIYLNQLIRVRHTGNLQTTPRSQPQPAAQAAMTSKDSG